MAEFYSARSHIMRPPQWTSIAPPHTDGAGGSVTLPAVPGETDDLPAGVKEVYGHQGEGWSGTGGAYLPPCSGGQGNLYTAKVKALGGADGDTVLGVGKVKLGIY